MFCFAHIEIVHMQTKQREHATPLYIPLACTELIVIQNRTATKGSLIGLRMSASLVPQLASPCLERLQRQGLVPCYREPVKLDCFDSQGRGGGEGEGQRIYITLWNEIRNTKLNYKFSVLSWRM